MLLVAFVPLLFIENYFFEKKTKFSFLKVLNYSFLSFFIWNILTTYWIYHSTIIGAIVVFVINSFFQSIVFALFHLSRKIVMLRVTLPMRGELRVNPSRYSGTTSNQQPATSNIKELLSSSILIFYWLTFEYIHHNWQFDWPWLSLGNGFANYPKLIQWYEYTGIFGGTLWILVSNIFVFIMLKSLISSLIQKNKKLSISHFLFSISSIVIPIIISLFIYYTYKEKSAPVNFVVVQPNIDPYNEKFDRMTAKEQLIKFLQLAEEKTDSTIDYIIGPETALVEGLWIDQIKTSMSYFFLKSFINQHPQVKMIVGLSSYQMYTDVTKKSETARPYPPIEGYYYDAYNSGMQIDSTDTIQLFHKSKLVSGSEKMPYPKVFKFLSNLFLDLGGTSGQLGRQKEPSVFISPDDSIKIAPSICYESVFGEYTGEFIKKGVHFICVITNDGWWGDTPGYKQHFAYARLRAIETRRTIIHCANTGISGFINQRGDILQKTPWWTPLCIKGTLNANNKLTFYTKYGDYLGRLSMYVSICLILSVIILAVIKRNHSIFTNLWYIMT